MPAAIVRHGCCSASMQHTAACQPLIQLHSSLQLIKLPAAIPDACLKLGHETKEIEAWCSWRPVCFFRLVSLVFTSAESAATILHPYSLHELYVMSRSSRRQRS